jgi:hypothetical protein
VSTALVVPREYRARSRIDRLVLTMKTSGACGTSPVRGCKLAKKSPENVQARSDRFRAGCVPRKI